MHNSGGKRIGSSFGSMENENEREGMTQKRVEIPQTQPQSTEPSVGNWGESSDEDEEWGLDDDNDDYEPMEDIAGEDFEMLHGGVYEPNDEGNALECAEDFVPTMVTDTEEDDYDPRMEGYQSGNESELEEDDVDPACPFSNPHSKVANATRGEPFSGGGDGVVNFVEGMTFTSVQKLREVLRDYRVNEGFLLKQEHNDQKRFRARCKVDGCPWKIVASAVLGGPSFMIRTYVGRHTCERKHKNNQANSKWVAEKWGDVIRRTPDISNGTLNDFIRRQFGCDVPDYTLYRAKRIALYGLAKEHALEFSRLEQYIHEVGKSNPGSHAVIKKVATGEGQTPLFQRMFLSFGAQRDGFLRGCRPFLGVDGCHLKGRYRGVLLSAVSIDANSGLFPVAFAVVEQENKHSWEWFFLHLKNYIGEGEPNGWTFMSDRQKGIISALSRVFPRSNVRFCARHILANLKTEIKEGTIPRGYFWEAVRATTEGAHMKAMKIMAKINPKVSEYMENIPKHQWARFAFDRFCKADHVTNNMTEAWNSSLGIIRGKAIVSMWEGIRRKIMSTMARRKVEAAKLFLHLPKQVQDKVDDNLQLARDMSKDYAGDGRYEVESKGVTYIVQMEMWSCNCEEWKVSGIPCGHAIKCLDLDRGDVAARLVHPSLTSTAYKRTYTTLIHPVPDHIFWEDKVTDPILPPVVKQQPGRPQNKRRREHGSPKRTTKRGSLRCSLCKGLGHNKRACPVFKTNRGVNRPTEEAGPSDQASYVPGGNVERCWG